MFSRLFVAGSVVFLCAGTAFCNIMVQPTLEHVNPDAVVGVPTLRRIFDAAAIRRVDMAIIADSNTRLGAVGTGHEEQMGHAFATRFGMYATDVQPAWPVDGWGIAVQGIVSGQSAPWVQSSAPQAVLDVTFRDYRFPRDVATLPEGSQTNDNYFGTLLTINPVCPLDITAHLRFHTTHYMYGASSPGRFTLTCHDEFPGDRSVTYARKGPISTAGQEGLSDIAMDIPAGPRGAFGIVMGIVDIPNHIGAQGPITFLWSRMENADLAHGIAYSPYWYGGGNSSRDVADSLKLPGVQTATTEWFRQITQTQTGPGMLVFQILHGGNDCSDGRLSEGPIGGIPSNTGPGFADNIHGIINKLRSWWVTAGYSPSNLFFIIGPYHPRDEMATQLEFEQAARDIVASDPQVVAIAGNRLSTVDEFVANNYYINPFDHYHLSASGYQHWAHAALQVMDAALNPADSNGDHVTNINDIFAFLRLWFIHQPTADADFNGHVDIADIFAYLRLWFGSYFNHGTST